LYTACSCCGVLGTPVSPSRKVDDEGHSSPTRFYAFRNQSRNALFHTNSSPWLTKAHLNIESTRFRKAPRFVKSKERKGIATDNEEPLENGSYRELFNVHDDPFCRGTDRRW
jgi:hypothetical protein